MKGAVKQETEHFRRISKTPICGRATTAYGQFMVLPVLEKGIHFPYGTIFRSFSGAHTLNA
jgi:hypothetical protein